MSRQGLVDHASPRRAGPLADQRPRGLPAESGGKMLTKRSLAIAAISCALSPIAAMAGTIVTSPRYTGTLTTIVICEAYNVGNKPIDSVTVTLVPAFGVGDSVTCTDLGPAGFCQDSVPSPAPFT